MKKHIRYPKIKNHTHASQLHRAELFASSRGVGFVGTEKVHGCNFSFVRCRGGQFWFARRNGVLNESNEFYGWKEAIAQRVGKVTLHGRLQNLTDEVLKARPEVTQVVVFGELFGGSYPDTASAVKRRPVQSEIPYARDVQFLAFDILVFTPEGRRFLAPSKAHELCGDNDIPFAPVVYRADSLPPSVYTDFKTRVPEMFGEDPDHAAEAEGFVLIPDCEHGYSEREEIGIKYKSPRFVESRGRKKPPEPMSDESLDLVRRLAPLICAERVTAVASKELESIHPGHLAAKVAADALEEAEATGCDKRVRQQLTNLARPLALDFKNRQALR